MDHANGSWWLYADDPVRFTTPWALPFNIHCEYYSEED
jgi:hypothetical protein